MFGSLTRVSRDCQSDNLTHTPLHCSYIAQEKHSFHLRPNFRRRDMGTDYTIYIQTWMQSERYKEMMDLGMNIIAIAKRRIILYIIVQLLWWMMRQMRMKLIREIAALDLACVADHALYVCICA